MCMYVHIHDAQYMHVHDEYTFPVICISPLLHAQCIRRTSLKMILTSTVALMQVLWSADLLHSLLTTLLTYTSSLDICQQWRC